MEIPLPKRRSLFVQIYNLLQYREMLVLWTARELRSRYRQSFLGIGWAFLQPLAQTIVLSLVFGIFVKVPSDGFPYPIFLYAGLLPWTLFASSITSAIPSVSGNMPLVGKIYFPREILPIAATFTRVFDFLVASVVFIALAIWYHVPFHATVLYVPVLLLIQIFLALGIALVGSACNVFLRDISFALPVAMQLWMYATPVIYPLQVVPERWRNLYLLNPMAGIIDSYRRVILAGLPPDIHSLQLAIVVTILLCLFGYSYFKKLELAMSDVL